MQVDSDKEIAAGYNYNEEISSCSSLCGSSELSYESISNEQSQFGCGNSLSFLRHNVGDEPWYSQPCFDRYWRHYNLCQKWLQHHFNYCSSAVNYCYPQNDYKHSLPEEKKNCFDQCKYSKRNSPKVSKNLRRNSSNKSSKVGNEEFQMEVSEDLLNFLAQSARHRNQRG